MTVQCALTKLLVLRVNPTEPFRAAFSKELASQYGLPRSWQVLLFKSDELWHRCMPGGECDDAFPLKWNPSLDLGVRLRVVAHTKVSDTNCWTLSLQLERDEGVSGIWHVEAAPGGADRWVQQRDDTSIVLRQPPSSDKWVMEHKSKDGVEVLYESADVVSRDRPPSGEWRRPDGEGRQILVECSPVLRVWHDEEVEACQLGKLVETFWHIPQRQQSFPTLR